jgi:hypothetical protein
MTKAATPKTLGIFFISFENSSRLYREEMLRKEILSFSSKIVGLKVVFWKSCIWQPTSISNLKRSFGKYIKFKFLSERVWFGASSLKSCVHVFSFEVLHFFKGESLIFRKKDKIYRERVLSDKHFRAWIYALDSGVDFALFLEDDVCIEATLKETLQEVVTFLDLDNPTFVNLSRANELAKFKKHHVLLEKVEGWFTLNGADTTAAYIANNECLKILAQELSNFGSYDALAIDFVVSSIFFKNPAINVLHRIEPPFSNGTLVGKYESEINKNT